MISKQVYDRINYLLLILAFVGISTTKLALSWCTVLFSINFLIGPKLGQRFRMVGTNPINQIILLLIGLYIIGLAWSEDLKAGLKVLKNMAPFLVIPMIAVTTHLEKIQIHNLFRWFIAGLLFTSVFNVLYINEAFGSIVGDDIREMSRFGSHTRYALLIVLGVLTCMESIRKKDFNLFPLPISILFTVWFTFYTLYSQILSGFISLSFLFLFYMLLLIWKTKKKGLLIFICSFIIGTIVFICIKLFPPAPNVDCDNLEEKTKLGNIYFNSCQYHSEINGHPIFAYYQEEELSQAWNEKSKLDFFGLDNRQHPLKVTIARYMTAKGLRKDREGFDKLTAEDIKNIELGKVYPNENRDLLMTRLYSMKYELMYTENPNGKSLLQRLEHWKASLYIIVNHPLIGVGTGGNQKAFDKAYNELKSPLYPENRMRSHNMFFAVQISLGLLGTFIFLTLFISLIKRGFTIKSGLTVGAIIVLCSSFLMEDTLETQVGIYILSLFILPIFQKGPINVPKTD